MIHIRFLTKSMSLDMTSLYVCVYGTRHNYYKQHVGDVVWASYLLLTQMFCACASVVLLLHPLIGFLCKPLPHPTANRWRVCLQRALDGQHVQHYVSYVSRRSRTSSSRAGLKVWKTFYYVVSRFHQLLCRCSCSGCPPPASFCSAPPSPLTR